MGLENQHLEGRESQIGGVSKLMSGHIHKEVGLLISRLKLLEYFDDAHFETIINTVNGQIDAAWNRAGPGIQSQIHRDDFANAYLTALSKMVNSRTELRAFQTEIKILLENTVNPLGLNDESMFLGARSVELEKIQSLEHQTYPNYSEGMSAFVENPETFKIGDGFQLLTIDVNGSTELAKNGREGSVKYAMMVCRKMVENFTIIGPDNEIFTLPSTFIGDGIEIIVPDELVDIVSHKLRAIIGFLQTIKISIDVESVETSSGDVYLVPIENKDSIIYRDNVSPYSITDQIMNLDKQHLSTEEIIGVGMHPSKKREGFLEIPESPERVTMNVMLVPNEHLSMNTRTKILHEVVSFIEKEFGEDLVYVEDIIKDQVDNVTSPEYDPTLTDGYRLTHDGLKLPENILTFICPASSAKTEALQSFLNQLNEKYTLENSSRESAFG
jgi:hypothetical protein